MPLKRRSNVRVWLDSDMDPPENLVCFGPESGRN